MKLLACIFLTLAVFSARAEDYNSTICEICKCRTDLESGNKLVTCEEKTDELMKQLENATFYVDVGKIPVKIKELKLNMELFTFNVTLPNITVNTFNLSHCMITKISDGAFKNLQMMEELDLSNNGLKNLQPDVFKGLQMDGQDYPLRNLRTLRLGHNELRTLHPDIFEHVDMDLEEIYLNDNPFKVIDSATHGAINSVVNLKILDLSNMGLSKLPQYFMHTPGYLQTLRLSGNNFTKISELGLEDSHALQTLYLDNNPIANITKNTGFPQIKTLKTLYLCHMPELEEVSDHSMCSLENLVELHLHDNIKLRNIQPRVFIRLDEQNGGETPVLLQLKKLYLQNNKLAHLNMELDWSTVTDIDIANNPWTCECENQWLIDTIIPKYIDQGAIEDAKKLQCAAPIEMIDKNMYDIFESHNNMRCLDLYGNRPENDGTILVCILIGLLLGIVVVLSCVYFYKRHWFGLFDDSPAAFSRQFYTRTKSFEEDGPSAAY